VRSCNRSIAGSSAAVSGKMVSASSLMDLELSVQALPLSICLDSGPSPVAQTAATA
jgi:hypothetical protein